MAIGKHTFKKGAKVGNKHRMVSSFTAEAQNFGDVVARVGQGTRVRCSVKPRALVRGREAARAE
ncbi:MAG: hypothetical protein N2595_09130 [bacterium]|nr:hypothetical protein [bacterium]